MRAQKAVAIDIFIALHRAHFSGRVIAKLTGYSAAHVCRMLLDAGMRERWSNVADVRAELPPELLESCARLIRARG
jgi:hypothetical protein